MGDTIIPFKAFIQKEESDLYYFRGALLPQQRRALDELFIQAELMIAALTMAEHLPRSEALHLVMLVALTKDLLQLRDRVDTLESQVKVLQSQPLLLGR
jgi:hypothetical protein